MATGLGLTRRLGLNSLWLFLARAAAQGLMLVFTILVARYLGQAGLGQYAFVTAVVFVGNVFTTFGMDTLLIRELAATRRPTPTLTAALLIQLAFSLLFIFALLLVAGRLSDQSPAVRLALRLYSLSLLPLAFSTVYSAALRAYERMDLYLLFNLGTAVLQTAGAFIVLIRGGDLVALVWLLLLAQVAGAAIAALLCARYLPGFSLRWPLPAPALISQTLRTGWLLALLMVLTVTYQRLGIFSLSLLVSDDATGWFSAAARLVEAARSVPYAVFGALFPVMARVFHKNSDTLLSVDGQRLKTAGANVAGDAPVFPGQYPLTIWLLLLFSVAAALALTLAAERLILWLYGDAYAPAIAALRILAWSLAPFVASLKLSFELVAQGRELVALQATVITVAVAAVLYIAFIQVAGLAGACWAAVAAETVQVIIFYALAARSKERVKR